MAVINAIAWPLRLLAVGLVTAGLGTGVYFLAQAGDSNDEPTVVVAGTATGQSPTEEAGTPTEAYDPTQAPPTQVPPTFALATATPDLSLPPDFPPVDCGGPRYHLSVAKLEAHPNLAGALVSEVDQDTVRIEIQGFEFTVTGWGGVLTIGGAGPRPSQELDEQVGAAIHAVLWEC